ncbi:MAG: hypothetical protein Q9227_001840 [Pyrenula ochraceoflavens]
MASILRPLVRQHRNTSAFNRSYFSRPPLVASFSISAPLQAKSGKKKRKPRKPSNIKDQYRQVQAQARKEANLARQKVLSRERTIALGDPVVSKSTPFMESLRSGQSLSDPALKPRNFLLSPDQYAQSLKISEDLARPSRPNVNMSKDPEQRQKDENEYRKQLEDHNISHTKSVAVLDRITSLEHGSSQDKTRANKQRCIEEFGRHQTDLTLPPRPIGPAQEATPPPPVPHQRVGPDTGSSEVQVAILTTKIDRMNEHVSRWGHKDKHNKRNLRLLVHRRQKLLAYLRRKERGGPRFTNLMEKLGLADAAWQGEISM